MKSKLFLFAALSMALLVTALPCSAQGFGKMMNLERLGDELGLSDKQLDSLESIRDASVKKALDVKRDLEYSQYELKKAMQSDAPDRSKINTLIEDIHKTRAQIQKIRVGAVLDMKAVLTPEQQTKLSELRESRKRGGRQGLRGHGRGSGFGHQGHGRQEPMDSDREGF